MLSTEEIEDLLADNEIKRQALADIHSCCIRVGGALNGNYLNYTTEQMGSFLEIKDLAEAACKDT